jgi:Tfp pilus assembly protein PilW
MLMHTLRSDERGFTMAELLVSTMVSMIVLGGAVAITSQVQQGYRRQIEETAAEQEGRYALDWVSRLIRAAGNNPYTIVTANCPVAATPFAGLIMDPNLDGIDDDIRLQTDSNPPDQLLGGTLGSCTQANEDVTVSFNSGTRSITFLDNNLGGGASVRTEAVITNLRFVYLKADRTATTNPAEANQVMYVRTNVTIQPRAAGLNSGTPLTRTLTQEVRIRGRNF